MFERRSIAFGLGLLGAFGVVEGLAGDNVEPDALRIRSQLRAFAALPKFGPTATYVGAATPMPRTKYEAAVNDLAGRLVALSSAMLARDAVLREFSRTLEHFEDSDAADFEQLAIYLNELSRLARIDGTNNLLDTWRYGFDPHRTAAENNAAAVLLMSPRERAVLAVLDRAESATAVEFLTREFGTPMRHPSGSLQWFITVDRRTVASLSMNSGLSQVPTSVGLLRQRTFSYVKELERNGR